MEYSIYQHKTKSGKTSAQWDVFANDDLITVCTSKKQAVNLLNHLQDQTNDNHKDIQVDQQVPVQQRDAGTNQRTDSGTGGGDENNTADESVSSLSIAQKPGDALDIAAVQIQERLSTFKRSRSEDSEPHPEFPGWIRELNADVQRGAECQHQLVREQGQLVREQGQIVRRVAGIAEVCIRVAERAVGINVGRTELGIQEQVHKPLLEVETIDVTPN